MSREKAANNNGYDDEIVALLTQVGQRLIHSEQDRKELKRAMDDLIEKADQGERAYLTIQDRLSKTESALEKRQKALEDAHQEQEAKLEKASAMADQMEEIIAQHAKINRRLEKVAQERARMIRKLERIEEAVIETHDTINAKMPALLSAQVSQKPSLPQALADESAEGAEDRPWWRQHGPVRAAAVAVMILFGIGGGWLLNQAGYRFTVDTPFGSGPEQMTLAASNISGDGTIAPPASSALAALDDAVPTDAGQDRFARAIEEALSDTAPAAGTEAEALAGTEEEPEAEAFSAESVPATFEPEEIETAEDELSDKDPLDMTDAELLASLNNDPDLLAARLNEITVGAGRAMPEDIADAAPAEAETAAEKAAFTPSKAPVNDVSTADFLKAQAGKGTLQSRIKADASLPAVIREVEKKAFEGIPEAQHDLAAIYTAGHGGVKVDYGKAAAWFREAAVGGVANARYNLGVLYHQGLGVSQDINTAVSWYRSAAEKGHPEAQYNLGIAHIEGVGTNYDPEKAAYYFEEAAKKGILEAAYNLGLIHENGLTGDSRPDEALYWYKQAADQGSPEAKAAMDQLAKTLGLQPGEVDRLYGTLKKAESAAPKDGTGDAASQPPIPVKTAKATGAPRPPVDSSDRYEYLEAQPLDASAGPTTINIADTGIAASSAATEDPATIAQIQEQLIRFGLYPGPADGINDGLTADAIRSYQAQNSLKSDGRASQALLVHMMTTELGEGSRER